MPLKSRLDGFLEKKTEKKKIHDCANNETRKKAKECKGRAREHVEKKEAKAINEQAVDATEPKIEEERDARVRQTGQRDTEARAENAAFCSNADSLDSLISLCGKLAQKRGGRSLPQTPASCV